MPNFAIVLLAVPFSLVGAFWNGVKGIGEAIHTVFGWFSNWVEGTGETTANIIRVLQEMQFAYQNWEAVISLATEKAMLAVVK